MQLNYQSNGQYIGNELIDETDQDKLSFLSPSSMKKFTANHSKQASRIIKEDNSISVSKIEEDYQDYTQNESQTRLELQDFKNQYEDYRGMAMNTNKKDFSFSVEKERYLYMSRGKDNRNYEESDRKAEFNEDANENTEG